MSEKKILHTLKEENSALKQELAALQFELEQIKASKSWRLTGCLRELRRRYDRLVYDLILSSQKIRPVIQRYILCSYSLENDRAHDQLTARRKQVLFSEWHRSVVQLIHQKPVDLELPEIDITVVTYNNGRWLSEFGSSLRRQSFPLDRINLVFVDNSSTDNTRELLEEFQTQFKGEFSSLSVWQRPNQGFGAGHHFAIMNGSSAFILISNIDLTFTREAIRNAVLMATRDHHRAAAWEMRQAPYEHPKYYDPLTLETNWNSHAAILIRREAYMDVGGYDPKIFMYGEDVELSYRLRAHRYILRYCPYAVVNHFTYMYPHHIKDIQRSLSTYANLYIRWRYGCLGDRIGGIILQLILIFRRARTSSGRLIGLDNLKSFLDKNKRPENLGVKPKQTAFSFWGLDYELVRDGAFYETGKASNSSFTPLVSVITRTYKGRKSWLKEATASVLNQTYPHIEHVIVEDGGNSAQPLIREMQQTYGSFAHITYAPQPKIGRSAAGNHGLSLARGEYLLFLDDDDLFFPDHIETLVNALEKSSQTSAAYSLSYEVVTRIDRQTDDETEYREVRLTTPAAHRQDFDREKLLINNYIPIQSILFSRKLFDRLGGFDPSLDQLEDWNLWTKYALHSDFVYVPKTTSLYRIPFDKNIRQKREALLKQSYEKAVNKQNELRQRADGNEAPRMLESFRRL